jgi:hypothetical protein
MIYAALQCIHSHTLFFSIFIGIITAIMAAPPSLAVEQHDEDTTLEGVLALLDEYEASPASYACVFASSSSDDDALSLLPAAIESTAAAEHLSVVSAPPLRELLALMPPPLQLLSPSAPLVLGTRPLTLTSKPRAGSKKALARGNTNKARDDRKEELIYLRRKVVELETQLTAIKKSLPIPKRSDGPAVAKDEPLARKSQQRYSSVAPVWKELAVRQCDKRMKSERENIRLKLVLENQIMVAKSLEKFLLKTAMSSVSIAYLLGRWNASYLTKSMCVLFVGTGEMHPWREEAAARVRTASRRGPWKHLCRAVGGHGSVLRRGRRHLRSQRTGKHRHVVVHRRADAL